MHLRPIIEAGKLYKVYSPLYRLDCKDHEFVANKSELISVYYEKLVNIYKIKPELSDSFLSKSEMMEFLMDTYDYLENLINAAKESGKIDKFLVEMIGGYLTIYNVVNSEDDFISNDEAFSNQKFIKTIMSKIQKKYPEVKVDNHGRFSGIVNGHLAVIQTERRFYKKISRLIPVYKKYGLTLEVKERGKDKVTKMTIGEFLEASLKHQPSILHRFKGLGEINSADLRKTTMDINNRISVRYTVEDVERELAIFKLTHGGSTENMADRKKLMQNYKIKREDLDN